MARHARAIVKDEIFYSDDGASQQAPCGEYTIDRRCDCVRLCTCNGDNAFTLSLDAFIQHLSEGRIAVVA